MVGITEWIDLQTGDSLLKNDYDYAPFTPVYEASPADSMEDITFSRSRMYRNRKSMNVERTEGRLTHVKVIDQGELLARVELSYALPNAERVRVQLTAYADQAKVDVSFGIHKQHVWEAENVYISLPFSASNGSASELWLEKTDSIFRPWIDQLPGTSTDFYCIQEGVALLSEQRALSISMPDTPMVQLGSLEFGDRLLQGNPDVLQSRTQLYSWPLNNFWETNFKAIVGGNYEFRYGISWDNQQIQASEAIEKCREMNTGIPVIRL